VHLSSSQGHFHSFLLSSSTYLLYQSALAKVCFRFLAPTLKASKYTSNDTDGFNSAGAVAARDNTLLLLLPPSSMLLCLFRFVSL
jgi:hypothetical protein